MKKKKSERTIRKFTSGVLVFLGPLGARFFAGKRKRESAKKVKDRGIAEHYQTGGRGDNERWGGV